MKSRTLICMTFASALVLAAGGAFAKGPEQAKAEVHGSFYQLSESGPPDYRDMVEVVQAIVANRSDNIIWGSNWPHGGVRVPMPATATCSTSC